MGYQDYSRKLISIVYSDEESFKIPFLNTNKNNLSRVKTHEQSYETIEIRLLNYTLHVIYTETGCMRYAVYRSVYILQYKIFHSNRHINMFPGATADLILAKID